MLHCDSGLYSSAGNRIDPWINTMACITAISLQVRSRLKGKFRILADWISLVSLTGNCIVIAEVYSLESSECESPHGFDDKPTGSGVLDASLLHQKLQALKIGQDTKEAAEKAQSSNPHHQPHQYQEVQS